MKRIIIILLLFPVTMMAMEQQSPASQNNNEPLYVGILTHIISEITHKGVPHLIPFEEDIIVYEYNKQSSQFDWVARNTINHIRPELTKFIKILPDPSFDFRISKIAISKSNQKIEALINTTLTTLDNQHRPICQSCFNNASLEMGTAMRDAAHEGDLPRNTSSLPKTAITCEATFHQREDSSYCYMPGITCKSIELGKHGKQRFYASEIVGDSQRDAMLKFPGPHKVAAVVAFLKLEKLNDKYIPAFSEKCSILNK
jgi:hypothetical protein